MQKGLLFGFAAYTVYAFGDAFVKAAGPAADTFTIGFFVTLFSVIPFVLTRGADERWSQALHFNRPLLVHMRGFSMLAASVCSIYAFTNLPLAEAYALIFLIPLVVTALSVVFLGETIGWRRWLAVVIGLAGVLVVVRPGFREVGLAHLAGFGIALFGALNIVLMRKLGNSENRLALMSILYIYLIGAFFVLMLPNFSLPTGWGMAVMALGGLCAGMGHFFHLLAAKNAEASMVAPTQYIQIIWAVALGAIFFGEYPDGFTYLGLAIVVAAGLFIFLREMQLGIRRPAWTFFRPRL